MLQSIDLLRQSDPIHPGHLVVGDDQVEWLSVPYGFSDELQCFRTAETYLTGNMQMVEETFHQPAVCDIVVYHQYFPQMAFRSKINTCVLISNLHGKP